MDLWGQVVRGWRRWDVWPVLGPGLEVEYQIRVVENTVTTNAKDSMVQFFFLQTQIYKVNIPKGRKERGVYGNIMTISMHAVQQSEGSPNKNCVGMFIDLPHAF